MRKDFVGKKRGVVVDEDLLNCESGYFGDENATESIGEG